MPGQRQDNLLSSDEDALEIVSDPRPSKMLKFGLSSMPKVMLLPQCSPDMDECNIDGNVVKWDFVEHLVKERHLSTAIEGVCRRLVNYNFGMDDEVTEYMKLYTENICREREERVHSTSS